VVGGLGDLQSPADVGHVLTFGQQPVCLGQLPHVIADAARPLPHTLRRVDAGDDALAELEMLVGYDDDLAGEATRISNRIRGLLRQIHPALERVLGPKIAHPAVLEALSRCGGPAGLRKAGHAKLNEIITARAPRMGARLVEQILAALGEQTVVVPGTATAETILHRLADTSRDILRHRDQVDAQVERMLDAHPLAEVLTSMPGIGVRTGARILLEVGDAAAFPTSGHLAAYAGLAPATRRSGSSIRGEHPPKGDNKQLKRAFFLAAFASLAHPPSRAYYDRNGAEGKKHNAALICLARRRVDVLHAMLRTKTTYQVPAADEQPQTA
jgi:transposase